MTQGPPVPEKRPWRRSALWGFLAGGLMFVIGAPLPHSILVGLAILVAGPVLDAASIELHDRPEVPRRLRREGSRHELAKLTRYRGRRSRGPDEEAIRRLRTIARRRLADLGVEVDDPAQVPRARQLLGSFPYGVLLAQPSAPRISDRHFSHCIRAVEALARHRRDRVAGATDARGAS